MSPLSRRHSINREYELGSFTACNPVLFPTLTPSSDHGGWAAALESAVVHSLVLSRSFTRVIRKNKGERWAFSRRPSLPLLFPLHLNQKFLISPVPVGRDLVYVRALRPARVHGLHSKFLKDEKEKGGETVETGNREKRQMDLYWYEHFNTAFFFLPFSLTFLLEHYVE